MTGRFVPALGYRWLTPYYDRIVALTTRERTFKKRLIEKGAITDSAEVLDLGCGTGTLAIWIKLAIPKANVTGLDGDQQMLSRAQEKADRAGVEIRFDLGMSFILPYADASFDRVLSSLFFHHLTRSDKERTVREIVRVLRPGGQLHIADWGKPSNALMRVMFYGVQLLDGFETTRDNVRGRLPTLLRNGGLEHVSQVDEVQTILGTLALYSANRAG